MLRSRQTLVNALLLVFALLAAVAWSMRHERSAAQFVSDVFLPIYVSFLLPLFSLCYASHGLAGERHEQTLVYLLATPLPRPVIYVAKWGAAWLLVTAWNLIGLVALGRAVGPVAWNAVQLFWPAVLWSSLAYTCLFHLFSVLLRRATVVSLVYALFLETFLGNMPGIIKRVAVSYYTQCLVFAEGEDLGLGPAGGRDPALFLPISGDTAYLVLCAASAGLFLIGLWAFCRREY
jgi:ABC-type transport system involved in multi-copper enzyme maturation permease subunit